MLLLLWLSKGHTGGNKKTNVTLESVDPLLPCPALEANAEKRDKTAAANKTMEEAVAKEVNSRKRKLYRHYNDELKVRLCHHAAEYGNKSAVEKFSKELEGDNCVRA